MRVEVRGKSFDIDLVNNYVHEQYSKLTEMSYDLVSLADEVGNLQARRDRRRCQAYPRRATRKSGNSARCATTSCGSS